ncbi:signal peptide peptidase SppA [Methanocella conradii]|uniref:signal peptide peptidase SppA n=1 Tax=Methanocella conradii TaxID=1175444 RepID=UPI0024B38A5F|nr:signal peptide peptidase SppA [Methanocella conradii]MDI6895704.1 signal peptide peptidase SppA [Methanocella conradii]
MDKDELLLFNKKSRPLMVAAFLFILTLVVAVAWVAYAGMMHRPALPEDAARILGMGKQDKIAVIYVEGQMVSDKSADAAAGSAFSSDVVKAMRAATDDPDVKAIVLRVNSPGGTPVAAEEIISQMKKTRAVKPIVVSMGDIATSAAYYISSQADRIVANPDTFTGSIGVIWVFKNKSKYYDEGGVSFYVAKTGNYKDLGSDWRGLTPGEKEYVNAIIEESYNRFVENVAKGRNLSVEDVRKIADGRVFTGATAKKMGLVDELGGLYDAVALAKSLGNIKGRAVIAYMNEPAAK